MNDERSNCKEQVISEVAQELGYKYFTVSAVFHSQFQFTAKTMKEGNFEGVRIPLLGRFRVKPGRLQYLNNNNAAIRLHNLERSFYTSSNNAIGDSETSQKEGHKKD